MGTGPTGRAKVSMDVSGPYEETSRGNMYTVSFVDWLLNWPEAYAVPNKKTQTVTDLVMNKIFPQNGVPVQLITNNGPENVNRVMTEVLASLNSVHITTSPIIPRVTQRQKDSIVPWEMC